MTIPDYISPIVAYRAWQWDAAGLKSLNNEPWIPDHCLAAACRRVANAEAAPLAGHDPPHDGCSCGVYAAKNLAHLRNIGYADFGVNGEVYLWGKVVEHRFGYRAQYAYPKSIVLPHDTIPFKLADVQSRLEILAAYGADISIAPAISKNAPIPLWSRRSGYDRAGLDWLIEKRNRWYSYREQERSLKPGDRVAVIGRGIGVVAHADDKYVRVRLWSKLNLWMRRRQVAWNEQNSRWEGDPTGRSFEAAC